MTEGSIEEEEPTSLFTNKHQCLCFHPQRSKTKAPAFPVWPCLRLFLFDPRSCPAVGGSERRRASDVLAVTSRAFGCHRQQQLLSRYHGNSEGLWGRRPPDQDPPQKNFIRIKKLPEVWRDLSEFRDEAPKMRFSCPFPWQQQREQLTAFSAPSIVVPL